MRIYRDLFLGFIGCGIGSLLFELLTGHTASVGGFAFGFAAYLWVIAVARGAA